MTLTPADTDFRFAVEPIASVAALETLWRGFDRSGSHSFFLTWTWIGTWLSQLPAGVTPLLLKALQGGETAGVALLTVRPEKLYGVLPFRQASLNTSGDPALDGITIEHNGFAAARILGDRFWPSLLNWFAAGNLPADELMLGGVPPAAQPADGASLLRLVQPSPAYRTALSADAASLLSRNSRQQLRRSIRAYEDFGSLRLEAAQSPQEALDFFARLKDLHVRSWARRGRRHAFASPFFETFHRALIEAAFAEGGVDLLRVSAGRRVLGYLYSFRRNGTVSSYQSGFDDGDPHLRPGYVCHALAMEHYAAQGMACYDFLAGTNRLKETFATERYELCWSRYRKPTLAFRADGLARAGADLLKAGRPTR